MFLFVLCARSKVVRGSKNSVPVAPQFFLVLEGIILPRRHPSNAGSMSGGVYGGDEVGALVFDPGHYTFRIGYAGEELPKTDIPSTAGLLMEALDAVKTEAMEVDENRPPGNANGLRGDFRKRFLIDTNSIHVPVPQMEMTSFLSDGMIEDWDMFEAVLDYAFKKQLCSHSSMHPVLMSEPPWNAKLKREQMTELMFEKFQIPAFFLCKNAVLAAFANGRSSGLVLDSGAAYTVATPVFDGFCCSQAMAKSTLAGDAITDHCNRFFQENNIDVVPPYLISGKDAVSDRQEARWTRKTVPEVTKSFHQFMVKEVVQDFQAGVLQVSECPLVEPDAADKMPALHYEFPNGYNQDFVSERMAIPEALFDTNYLKIPKTRDTLPMQQVATASVGMCDIDIRTSMYGAVIVTGGNTLLQGFMERLQYELQQKCPPSCKLKLLCSPTPAERRFGSWIGGSILASLGTFQQMWVSKQEYDESGKGFIEKKCP